jgi:hypothetical protein
LEGLGMENVAIFFHIWFILLSFGHILCPFGTFWGQLVYFARFGLMW